MSARERFAALNQVAVDQRLDDRAVRILTDGRRHSPQAMRWALRRNPFMAKLTSSELALANYEVHRS